MPSWTRLLPLIALVVFSGCFAGRVKDGSPFDLEAAAALEIGTSTRADVLAKLGAPTTVIRLYRGEAYVYQRAVAKRSGLFLIIFAAFRDDTQRDGVTVVVDEKGIVRAVGTKKEADTASFGTPWGD